MTDLSKYAEALFLLSEEEGVTEKVRADLDILNSVLKESPEYASVLDTPALSKEERHRLVDEALGNLSEYVKNVVKMLSAAHSVYAFSRLYTGFSKLYNEKQGIVEVEAVSAVELTESEKSKIKAALESKLSKRIVIRNTVDKAILGGLVLRYGSTQLDGSVRTGLQKVQNDLKKVVI